MAAWTGKLGQDERQETKNESPGVMDHHGSDRNI